MGRVGTRKPLLRPANKKKRYLWALAHKDLTVEDWRKVLWTDESKFQVFGTNRRIMVRRTPSEKFIPQCLVPTVKHGGGSVFVWGCFSGFGQGDLVQITGILNKEGYKDILRDHAIPSGLRLIGTNFIMQQDNDPKHSSKLCRGYLQEKENEGLLKNMDWPAQSPDLNPIELLWEELDRKLRDVAPTSQKHLWERLKTCWDNLPFETLDKLIERMPRVVKAVLKSRGGFFDEKKV